MRVEPRCPGRAPAIASLSTYDTRRRYIRGEPAHGFAPDPPRLRARPADEPGRAIGLRPGPRGRSAGCGAHRHHRGGRAGRRAVGRRLRAGAGLAPLASPVGQLGLDPLFTDTTDVVGQLQSVAQQISVTSTSAGVDVKAGVLGAIAVDPSTAAAGVTVLPGIGLGVGPYGLDTDLTGVADVAHTLDADVVRPVDTIVDPVVGDVTGTVGDATGVLDGTDSGLLGGDLTGGVLPAPTVRSAASSTPSVSPTPWVGWVSTWATATASWAAWSRRSMCRPLWVV
ncbi:hypothetical protein NKG94_05395 [Micromonospora sp. M12]